MRFIVGIIAGLVAGIIGAAIWGGIVYATHYESSLVAWGIGVLVGIAVAVGCKGDTGFETGVIAAVIALLSIVGGKYFTVHLFLSNITAKAEKQIHATDEDGQMYLARRLIAEYESNSKPLKWPADMDAGSAKKPADYPPELWKDALARWKGMSPTDQAAYRDQVESEMRTRFQGKVSNAAQAGFKASFSAWDAIWFTFAVISAFKLGSGWEGDED